MNTLIAISIVALIVLGPHFLSIYLIQRKERRKDKVRNAWWDDLENKAELDRKLSDDPGCENEELLLTHPKDWEAFYYDDKN